MSTGVERLRRLIDVLRDVERLSLPFSMVEWYEEVYYSAEDVGEDEPLCRPLDCGTAACAVGWATRDPWFQEEGLRALGEEPVFRVDDRVYQGWDAVKMFFELDSSEAFWLLSGDQYGRSAVSVSPGLVADRIGEYLAGVAWVEEWEE